MRFWHCEEKNSLRTSAQEPGFVEILWGVSRVAAEARTQTEKSGCSGCRRSFLWTLRKKESTPSKQALTNPKHFKLFSHAFFEKRGLKKKEREVLVWEY